MTEAELITTLQGKFTALGVPADNPSELLSDGTTLRHKAIPCFDDTGSALLRQWVHYYVKADGTAFWQDREPKPTPLLPAVTFTSKLQQYLDAAAVAGTPIKAGTILWSSDVGRVAKLEVVTVANALKQAIITADVGLNFNPPVILA